MKMPNKLYCPICGKELYKLNKREYACINCSFYITAKTIRRKIRKAEKQAQREGVKTNG